jgi:hypothetical protein
LVTHGDVWSVRCWLFVHPYISMGRNTSLLTNIDADGCLQSGWRTTIQYIWRITETVARVCQGCLSDLSYEVHTSSISFINWSFIACRKINIIMPISPDGNARTAVMHTINMSYC